MTTRHSVERSNEERSRTVAVPLTVGEIELIREWRDGVMDGVGSHTLAGALLMGICETIDGVALIARTTARITAAERGRKVLASYLDSYPEASNRELEEVGQDVIADVIARLEQLRQADVLRSNELPLCVRCGGSGREAEDDA